ncbi:hypothetical protein [Tahibacter harae]|uniref:Ice nucleation protein n=1 Tax=Tahibacter harae TaxID=2963937 RepID=A0ABT1QS25_9GAMM|nr:hypothetical protein [Tahibacter harae]MCQ4165106.1 hypothetical protein [Tahibacter harae]
MKRGRKTAAGAAAPEIQPAPPATSLVLRCCSAELRSHGGFQWPDRIGALVEAPDWSPREVCGFGLHGWLHGAGDHSVADHAGSADAKWLVLEVVSSEIVMLGGKCKFPRCTVRFIGDRGSAAAYLIEHEPQAKAVAVIGAVACDESDQATVLVGALGTATAGYRGTATAGYRGTATAGNYGTATAGESGTATAGYRGTATAGNYGTATAGYRGTATAGNYGTATAGESGTATAGESGELRIQWLDEKAKRYRTAIAYVGEDGIKPDTKYRLDDNHKFVEVES